MPDQASPGVAEMPRAAADSSAGDRLTVLRGGASTAAEPDVSYGSARIAC